MGESTDGERLTVVRRDGTEGCRRRFEGPGVRGTVTVCGTGITSFTWCSATNQLSAPTWNPSFDERAAREDAVRILSATEIWNSRSPVRRAIVPIPAP